MKPSTRIRRLIVTLIVILSLAIPVGWIAKDVIHQQRVLAKCPELKRYHMSLEACYGILVIESDVDGAVSKYLIDDYKHGLYVVAGINNLNKHKVLNDTMYIIDESPHGSTLRLDDGPTKFIVECISKRKSRFSRV